MSPEPFNHQENVDIQNPVSITITYDDMRSPAEVLSVSSGGVFLKTGLLLKLGAEVEIEFSHIGDIIATIRAQVSRIEPNIGSDEEMGIGLRYLNMDAKTWIRIEGLLFRTATMPQIRPQSNRVQSPSTSQRFRIIYQEQEHRINTVLAEIRDLHHELDLRYQELEQILQGSSQ